MNSIAQLTADFPDSNYHYNERKYSRIFETDPFDNFYYTVYHKKDTLINNVVYQLLYMKYKIIFESGPPPNKQGDIPIALIRNDKPNKKVYITKFGFNYWTFRIPKDTTEKLLFDFSLKVGDYYTPNASQNVNIPDSMYVRRIDTIIDPDNIKRAVFVIDSKSFDLIWEGIVIEGIGGRNGLLGSIFDVMDWSYQEELFCFSKNDLGYQASFTDSNALIQNAHTPCDVITFVSVQKEFLNKINIYPNPATDLVYFDTNEPVNHIMIYNHFGVLVKTEKIIGNKIEINELLPGVYSLKILSDETSYSAKILKE